uniref:Protein-S-isoprenylcysteine O-methyltransferase n=1 Tax=Syphacia muris TaxID=451379 RepID=A0A0N5AE30_9BILA
MPIDWLHIRRAYGDKRLKGMAAPVWPLMTVYILTTLIHNVNTLHILGFLSSCLVLKFGAETVDVAELLWLSRCTVAVFVFCALCMENRKNWKAIFSNVRKKPFYNNASYENKAICAYIFKLMAVKGGGDVDGNLLFMARLKGG